MNRPPMKSHDSGLPGNGEMRRAVPLGLAASFFFGFTFVLNRQMSLDGGPWIWTAALRYFCMLPLLGGLVLFRRSALPVLAEIRRRPLSWLIWSTVGFGLFYAPLCAASAFGPSWLLAACWQLTIIAGALLTPLFGKRVPLRALLFSLLILAGIGLLQAEEARVNTPGNLALGIGLVALAAFAYPLGNRKMMVLTGGRLDTVQRVFGMTLCSLPFWLGLGLIPALAGQWPSPGQLIQSAIVALGSGLIATLLFFRATELVRHDSHRLAAVESTQAGEVVFTLAGSVLLFGDRLPSLAGWAGLGLVLAGMLLNSLAPGRRQR
jgi:drug/metabolite transporter (DMT)-like permease